MSKRSNNSTQTHYRVVWEIDIYAASPVEAAREAQRIQRDYDSVATVFDCINMDDTHGTTTPVDLLEEYR